MKARRQGWQAGTLATVKRRAEELQPKVLLTFKPRGIESEADCNEWLARIEGQVAYALRGTGIGFLLLWELGKEGDVHFHAGISDLIPVPAHERLKKNFLRACGLANNQTRAFDCREIPSKKCAGYLAKEGKRGKGKNRFFRTKDNLPRWDETKLKRPYRFRRPKPKERAPGEKDSGRGVAALTGVSGDHAGETPTEALHSNAPEKIAKSTGCGEISPPDSAETGAGESRKELPPLNSAFTPVENSTGIILPAYVYPSEKTLMAKGCRNCWFKFGRYLPKQGPDCSKCGEPWRPALELL